MAFETGTATGPEDLLTKLETFIQSVSPQGFTIERPMTDRSPYDFAISDGANLHVQLHGNGTTDRIYVHQSTGFDDSGVPNEPGQSQTSIINGHEINRMTGPYTAYFFYANFDPAIGPLYVNVVVEFNAGEYRHFGFGQIEKFGSFSGGEYSHGHFWATGSQDDINSINHRVAFDGIGTTGNTSRSRMFLDVPTLSGWNGVVESPQSQWGCPGNSAHGLDPSGANFMRIQWSSRQAYYMHHFYEVGGSSQFNGFKPMMPILCWLIDDDPTPDEYYLLGFAKDVRDISMDGVISGQQLTIGGDLWDVYPMGKKSLILGSEITGLWGRAYKRIV